MNLFFGSFRGKSNPKILRKGTISLDKHIHFDKYAQNGSTGTLSPRTSTLGSNSPNPRPKKAPRVTRFRTASQGNRFGLVLSPEDTQRVDVLFNIFPDKDDLKNLSLDEKKEEAAQFFFDKFEGEGKVLLEACSPAIQDRIGQKCHQLEVIKRLLLYLGNKGIINATNHCLRFASLGALIHECFHTFSSSLELLLSHLYVYYSVNKGFYY